MTTVWSRSTYHKSNNSCPAHLVYFGSWFSLSAAEEIVTVYESAFERTIDVTEIRDYLQVT